ncbi:MAG TPA: CSLREA domain-containing protein, partial [Pyrinomonadaceae bacterium]|nr:CSLREA domain-containing protein [Pyrinomonadaceae bacterium]
MSNKKTNRTRTTQGYLLRLSVACFIGFFFLLLLQTADASKTGMVSDNIVSPSGDAIITVTTTADDITPNDGSVSLREAITASNAGNDLGDPDITAQNPGTFGPLNTINFNIPGVGVKTINVGSSASAAGIPLPSIVKPVEINGYTQGVATANTLANADNATILVELNGTSAGTAVNGLTLGAGCDGSTIKGLAINRFQADNSLNGGVGILVQSNSNTIIGNFIGVNPAGTAQMPNGGDGVRILNASNNQIGTTNPANRNIVSGNILDGIHIVGSLTTPATGNLIQGNFVGVAANGVIRVGVRTAPIPNAGALNTDAGNFLFGIEISGGNNNTVGGTTAGARNVVGFNGVGIEVDNGGQGNIIQ